jgi:ParB family chromosome partitioning protein
MSNAATVSSKTARPVLGRGLADLIPVGGNENARGGLGVAGTIGAGKQPIGEEVPLTLLHPNPNQPRTHFDPTALAELSASIKQNGVLQPILVRPRPAPLPGYEIVAGERRYRAARDAGLTKVPVVIRSLSDEETLAVALIENLIRQDIGPLETARAYSRLMSEFGWTQEEMGKRVGKSRVSVANHLRLLKLPQEIQEAVERGELSEGHARGLLGGEAPKPTATRSAPVRSRYSTKRSRRN